MNVWLIALLLVFGIPLCGAEEARLVPFSECIQVPIRVHLLSSKEVQGANTRLRTEDVGRIIDKANRVWLQAGILLVPQMISREEVPVRAGDTRFSLEATASDLFPLRKLTSIASNALNIYYIHEFDVNGIYFPEAIFVKDSAALHSVEGGLDEPLPRVTAHEIGHAFGLNHRQSRTNLMASGTTGTWLNVEEIEKDRHGARFLNECGITNGVGLEITAKYYEKATRYRTGWNGKDLRVDPN